MYNIHRYMIYTRIYIHIYIICIIYIDICINIYIYIYSMSMHTATAEVLLLGFPTAFRIQKHDLLKFILQHAINGDYFQIPMNHTNLGIQIWAP